MIRNLYTMQFHDSQAYACLFFTTLKTGNKDRAHSHIGIHDRYITSVTFKVHNYVIQRVRLFFRINLEHD